VQRSASHRTHTVTAQNQRPFGLCRITAAAVRDPMADSG
jgi:hypothetical protein